MASRLAVYCGSNLGVDERFVAEARALGAAMAAQGIGLVYGGGRVGLMGAVADAVLGAGGDVVGVITSHLVGAEVAHPDVAELYVVETMHERKARMAELAAGLVALPGGFGTLDEVLEMLTWNQLGLVAKPVVFLDTAGFFGDLFAFFDRAVAAGFVGDVHRALAQRATTPDEAIALATAPSPPTPLKWIDRDTVGKRA